MLIILIVGIVFLRSRTKLHLNLVKTALNSLNKGFNKNNCITFAVFI